MNIRKVMVITKPWHRESKYNIGRKKDIFSLLTWAFKCECTPEHTHTQYTSQKEHFKKIPLALLPLNFTLFHAACDLSMTSTT